MGRDSFNKVKPIFLFVIEDKIRIQTELAETKKPRRNELGATCGLYIATCILQLSEVVLEEKRVDRSQVCNGSRRYALLRK